MTDTTTLAFDQLLKVNSRTMAFIWLNQPGWCIRACSKSALKKLGLSQSDIDAQKIDYAELIHPDDLHEVQRVVSAALKGKNEDNTEQLNYRLRGANNQWIWVETDSTQQILNEPGNPIMGFVWDVTDRYNTEAQLNANQDRLNLVLEGAQLGMWDWNPQTNEVICDERWAEQIGLPSDQLNLELTDWSSRVHPDDLDACLKAMDDHLKGETESYENVHRLRHAKGHWVFILDRGRVIERDAQGRPIKFIGTHTDVTPIKQVELDALAALNARERFFSSMSHELRTPLHAILATAELLEQQLTDSQHRQKISLVIDSSEYLLNVLKDILDVAKMQEGELQLQPGQFDLLEVIHQVEHLFSADAEKKGLKLSVELPSSSPLGLDVDRVRLAQILSNLLSNAIKYTEVGDIKLIVTELDDSLSITIQDTGRGIGNIENAFQPYKQEAQRRQDDLHTTGLGLTIVRNLTQLMGFELIVESQLGEGSKFCICIPNRLRISSIETLDVEEKSIEPEHWRKIKLLLVDDNLVNRVVAKAMLQSFNVEVVEAEDGIDAITKLQRETFDVVCMDLHMPNMGGLTATKTIRALSIRPQPKIIGMSADAFPETINDCMAAGMDDYLTKPFKQKDMLTVIDKVLAD